MKTFCFGEHQFIPERQLLLHGTTPVRIGGRAADILAALVERPGQVLTKDELMARVWPGQVVEPSNLKVNVAAIRKALGGEAGERSIIAVNGRGYRFAVPVEAWTATLPTTQRKPSLPAGPPLIGRAEAAAHITRLLRQHRLVTITGTGGVGKTSLAIHVANLAGEGYRHGAWLLDFGIVSDPACIAGALAAELGITVQADDILAALAQALREWQALLVFDCCEQALEETARIATRLLDAAPGLGILATSREALRARQERVYVLPPLELPPYSACRTAEKARAFPAVQLFLERATARAGCFPLDDSNVAEICAICRTLDGVPLALELAATRMDAFGPADLLALLHDRFGLLNEGRRSDPPRHQGLLATLDWSHDLLPEAERRVLRRLAVLAGPFTMDSAVAVAGDDEVTPGQVIDGVARLVAQSLVAGRPAGRTMQYRLLDTTRAYALRKLAESGEADAVHRRHATHCLVLCREIAGWLRRSPSDASVADEERTVDNLRAALAWAFSTSGDPPLGCTLTVAALPVWDAFSRLQDCVTYVEHARAVAAAAPRFQREHMMLFAALAVARLQTGGPSPEVEALWRQTLVVAECLEDTEYRLRALWGICDYRSWVGDHRAALALTEESRGLAERMGDRLALRNGERQAATSLRYLGRFDEARRLAEGLLDHVGRRGAAPDVPRFQNDPRVVAQGTLANLLWLQGHPDQAVDAATLALERAQRSGHPFAVTNALAHTAIPISLYIGDLDGAERLLAMLDEQVAQQAMPIWRAVGQCLRGILLLRRGRADGLEQLDDGLEALAATGFRMRYPAYLGAQASGLAAQGRLAEADRVLDTALSWSELNGEDWCHAELLRLRGALSARRGDGGAAEHWLGEALALARRQGALAWELRAATSLAAFWQQADRPDDAARLLGAVVARFGEGRDGADMAVARRVLAGGAARPSIEAATLA